MTVMTLYRVEQGGHLIMTAPLWVIERAFDLHKDAVVRVMREALVTKYCELHFNGRQHLGLSGPIRVFAAGDAT